MNKMPQRRLIQSVDRALKILDVLANLDEPISLTELAKTMGLDNSTVYRLVSTLRAHGYAQQDSRDKKYRLGPKAIELGQKALQKFTLRASGAPFVRELAAKTGETVNLVGLVGGKTVCIDKKERPGLITFSPRIGAEAPPYCTATGKAIAAYLPEEEAEQLVAQTEVRQLTVRTITDLRALKTHWREIREQGYALDNEEYHPGIRCLAAPIFDHSGAVVGSIGISASVSSLTPEKIEEFKQIVIDIGRELSRGIGYVESAE